MLQAGFQSQVKSQSIGCSGVLQRAGSLVSDLANAKPSLAG